MENIVGQIFGNLEIIDCKVEINNNIPKCNGSENVWLCKCLNCGREDYRSAYSLRKIRKRGTTGCFCSIGHDLTGQKFGFLTVIGRGADKSQPNGSRRTWRCECECGTIKDIPPKSLLNGDCQSCGCKKAEIVSKKIKGIHKKINIYDISGDYGICYNEDKTRYCYFDLDDYDLIKQYHWTIPPDLEHYVATSIDGKNIFMHRLIMGLGKYDYKTVVDHINSFKHDNRKENLRICSQSENLQNARMRKTNTSGYTGVSKKKTNNRWYAQIMINRKHISLGTFDTIEEAVAARKEAEEKYFGEYAYDPEKDMRLKSV